MLTRRILDNATKHLTSAVVSRRTISTARCFPQRDRPFTAGRAFAPACSPFVRHNSSTSTSNPTSAQNTTLSAVPESSLPSTQTASSTAPTPFVNPTVEHLPPEAIPQDLLVQPPPFTSEAATQAIHSIGTLQELGLARWYTPPGILQQLLEFVHISTGFAWVASIAVATVMIRVTLFPLMLKSIRNTSALSNINPLVKEEMAKLTKATKEGDKMEATKAQMAVQKLFKDNNVNPLMSIVPILVQMPVFVFFYYALNSMVALPVPGMDVGGLLWFPDLTAPDPKHILPFATSAMTLINFEIGAEVGASQGNQMNPAIRMLFRALMCLTPLFTWNFPVAIFGYWFTSSLFSLVQGFMFRNPAIRRYWKLPAIAAKPAVPAPVASSALTGAPAAAQSAAGLSGGFWKNFNETVQGMKDMKNTISEKAQAAALKQKQQEAAKPRVPTKFEEMDPKMQQRKIRQQERFAKSQKRKQQFSTLAHRAFSTSAVTFDAAKPVKKGNDVSKPDSGTSKDSDVGFGLDEVKNVLLEDMTTVALDELHEHRELRKYYRKIVYELPSLTEFTKEFVPPTREQALRFRYTTYFGEDHPAASKVVLEVDIRELELTEAERLKLMKLAGTRVDHDTFRLKMSCERFTVPLQNKKYLSDTLDKLIKEAKDTTDTFEDIPLDRRHMKKSRKPPFPKAWNMQPAKAVEAPEPAADVP